MIANILQLAAGILLAISSFIVKNIGFQVPIFGQKIPGSFESFKQTWMIRFGLVLLALGYAFSIIDWKINFFQELSIVFRLALGFGSAGFIVLIFFIVSTLLARRGYKNEPVLDENTNVPEGTFAIEVEDIEREK